MSRKKNLACCMLAFNAILRIRSVVPRALFVRLCQNTKKKVENNQIVNVTRHTHWCTEVVHAGV